MINKIRQWLFRKYLPAKAKETVWKENKSLKERIIELERQNEIDASKAYAAGMAYALRHMKISIRNEVK